MAVFEKTGKRPKTPISTTGPGVCGIVVISALILCGFTTIFAKYHEQRLSGAKGPNIGNYRCKGPVFVGLRPMGFAAIAFF